ncbi:MAG: type 4a pilus biogenesis protein PilO [Candidatus Omnitrophota bacterium]
MKKITKEQKKIIYISLILSAFTVFLWIFIITPQKNKLVSIRNRLSQAEAQITEIKQLTQGRDMAVVVTELNKKLVDALDKLPFRQEVVINYLSDNARNLGIEIKNINLSDKQSAVKTISGYAISEVPININLSGEYRAIGEYLNILRDDSVILIKIGKIDIKGRGEGYSYLDMSLEISAYFAKKVS